MWLVTGANGYLGAHLLKKLEKDQINFFALDRYTSADLDIKRINLCNVSEIEIGLGKIQFKGLVHLAALKNVAESEVEKDLYDEYNVKALQNLLNTISFLPNAHIIFASSAAVYGNQEGFLGEDSITKSISHYGQTKICGEILLEELSKTSDLTISNLRFFNLAGSGYRNKLSNGIFSHLHKAQSEKLNFTVRGFTRNTHDGTAVRDYIHVEDAAQVIVELMNVEPVQKFSTFNVGTGIGTSVKEVIKIWEQLTENTLNFTLAPGGDEEIDFSVSDISKITSTLNWKPNQDIESIINSEIKMRGHNVR